MSQDTSKTAARREEYEQKNKGPTQKSDNMFSSFKKTALDKSL